MSTTAKTVEAAVNREYEWGFVTDIEADALAPGLNEDIIRLISSKKNEPEFMLEWRLRAYRHWVKMDKGAGEPRWGTSRTRRFGLMGLGLLRYPEYVVRGATLNQWVQGDFDTTVNSPGMGAV